MGFVHQEFPTVAKQRVQHVLKIATVAPSSRLLYLILITRVPYIFFMFRKKMGGLREGEIVVIGEKVCWFLRCNLNINRVLEKKKLLNPSGKRSASFFLDFYKEFYCRLLL